MTQSKNIEMDVEITPKSKRLISIDALRGFVMIIMIILMDIHYKGFGADFRWQTLWQV